MHVLDGIQIPVYKGAILRGKGQSIEKYRDSVVSRAKRAEQIKMPFGMWTQDMGLSVLDGVHIGATWRIRVNSPCAVAM